MKTAGKVALGFLGLTIVGAGIFLASTSASASSKTDDPTKPSGGGDKPKPGGKKPKPGGGGGGGGGEIGVPDRVLPKGGLIFGTVDDDQIPDEFDDGSSLVLISNDCRVVLVGRRFWPPAGELFSECQEPPDGKLITALRAGQNACAFIDYLMNQEGITSAAQIGEAMIRELNPSCLNMPNDQWTEAMTQFTAWLKPHVNIYVGEAGGEMDW